MLHTITSPKESGGSYTQKMNEMIRLIKDKEYEVALIRASINYGWPNISAVKGNNVLGYRINNAAEWNKVVIPDGTYTLSLLNQYLQKVMRENNHYSAGANSDPTVTADDLYYIALEGNAATGRVVIKLGSTYQIWLNFPRDYPDNQAANLSTLRTTLGFIGQCQFGLVGSYEGDAVPDFLGLSEVHIHCNLVSSDGSYSNGKKNNILYTFAPTVLPYMFMQIQPSTPLFLPLSTKLIDNISFEITDQDGNKLTTGGESTTLTLAIRLR